MPTTVSSWMVCRPEGPLAPAAQRGDDLVERQDQVDVVGLPAQPVGEPGQHLVAPGTQEVVGSTSALGKPVSAGMGLAVRGVVRRRPAPGSISSRCRPMTLRTTVRPSRRSPAAAAVRVDVPVQQHGGLQPAR